MPFARRTSLVLSLALVGMTLPRVSGAGFSLFRNSWGDVLVSTDVTPEGRALTPPTPGQPVYFLGRVAGERLGTIPGDELPDKQKIAQLLTKILAKQGYVGAQSGVHDPTLFLIVQWGYLDPRGGDLLWFLGYHADQDVAAPAFPGQLGPEVWRRSFRSREIETILDSARGPIYGIIVTAFEFKSAGTAKPVIYWQSRIGLPAVGKSMAEALPTMFVAAGPAIGRPNDKPVLLDADAERDAWVDFGELKVIDVVDDPLLPAKRSNPKH